MSEADIISKMTRLTKELSDLEMKESEIVSSIIPDRQERELAWNDLMEKQQIIENKLNKLKGRLGNARKQQV